MSLFLFSHHYYKNSHFFSLLTKSQKTLSPLSFYSTLFLSLSLNCYGLNEGYYLTMVGWGTRWRPIFLGRRVGPTFIKNLVVVCFFCIVFQSFHGTLKLYVLGWSQWCLYCYFVVNNKLLIIMCSKVMIWVQIDVISYFLL